MKNIQILTRTVKILLRKKKTDKITDFLKRLHPADIADVLDRLEEKQKLQVFELLDTENAAESIAEVNNFTRDLLLDRLSRKRIAEIVDDLESDEAADLVAELPQDAKKQVLQQIPKTDASQVKSILKHEEGTAGSIMQLEYLSVETNTSIKDTIKYIRSKAKKIDDIHNIFVTQHKVLVGTVPIKNLITANPKSKINSIMEPDIASVNVTDDQEYVASLFKKYDLISVAVVDAEKKILGRITVDDILEVIEEESTEDIYKLAGVSTDESVHDSAIVSVRRRIPWLALSLLTTLTAGSVIGIFKNTIAALVVITVFLPMIAGIGGNAGIQTLTVILRGMALGEVTHENFKKILKRQMTAGMINGLIIGLLTALIAILWHKNPVMGIIVFVAISINVIIATGIGASIPIIFKSLKIDPALASSVIVTTFADVIGFLTLLGISTAMLVYLI